MSSGGIRYCDDATVHLHTSVALQLPDSCSVPVSCSMCLAPPTVRRRRQKSGHTKITHADGRQRQRCSQQGRRKVMPWVHIPVPSPQLGRKNNNNSDNQWPNIQRTCVSHTYRQSTAPSLKSHSSHTNIKVAPPQAHNTTHPLAVLQQAPHTSHTKQETEFT